MYTIPTSYPLMLDVIASDNFPWNPEKEYFTIPHMGFDPARDNCRMNWNHKIEMGITKFSPTGMYIFAAISQWTGELRIFAQHSVNRGLYLMFKPSSVTDPRMVIDPHGVLPAYFPTELERKAPLLWDIQKMRTVQ